MTLMGRDGLFCPFFDYTCVINPMTSGAITAPWVLLICREGTVEADRPLERGMAGDGVV